MRLAPLQSTEIPTDFHKVVSHCSMALGRRALRTCWLTLPRPRGTFNLTNIMIINDLDPSIDATDARAHRLWNSGPCRETLAPSPETFNGRPPEREQNNPGSPETRGKGFP